MTTQAQSDDFDIGKSIFDQLKDLPLDRQQRILRWVSESLGILLDVTKAVLPLQTQNIIGGQIPATTTSNEIGKTNTDIKTFIASKSPKSDNQFAAAVAYYYRFEASQIERKDSINGTVLQEAARLAGRNRLTEPNKTLNNAKGAGYLDSTVPGEFTINSVGENLVAMTLPSGVNTSTRQPKKKRNNNKKKK